MKTIISGKIFFVLLVLSTGCHTGVERSFTAGGLSINLNDKGELTALTAIESQRNYLHADSGRHSIMAIRVQGEFEYPASVDYDEKGESLTLHYPGNGVEAVVGIQQKERYLTFELVSITRKEDVELVLWGPFATTIKQTIGETVGVVRDDDFAIGIQALNKRTLGGYPSSEDDVTPSYDIFGTTSLVDVVDSVNILYRGHTALPKGYGSSLQAYTRNRQHDRVVKTMGHEYYRAPSFGDEGITGSKIALFGCPPGEVLNTIEAIELAEGLPHPTLEGVWSKRAATATSAYLIQSFSIATIVEAIALTKKAGLKYLYHGGPFETWGHFELKRDAFPGNWESMKVCVDKAGQEGIKVGVHTLSNFITTNDPYVTPMPDDRLARVGDSFLTNTVGESDKDIVIDDPVYFNQSENNNLHAVVLGKEIIRYESVSEKSPWTLLNCERGAFGTATSAHGKGEKISKLADHAYKTFLTNTDLSLEMAGTIADLFNQTGLKQISLDGLEGNHSTGMGAYGELLFVDAWYSRLHPSIKNDYIMDASRSGHYFWHLFTRMNWGEPWYAGFRESQTAYRLLNQDYFRRNFIPCMLGWFSMRDHTSIEDIEWMLTRSAAFDAGYALVTSPELVARNGFGDQILEKIKQWEKARMAGAFSAAQKKRMENIRDEFSLVTVAENSWNLIPWTVQRIEHLMKVRQPGEPVGTTLVFENNHERQPLQFILHTTEGASVSAITFELNHSKTVTLDIILAPDQFLKYDGGREAVLYDNTWNELQRIPVEADQWVVGSGSQTIVVDCRFVGKEGAGLKLELKTAGEREPVAPH